ncbi:MAG: ribosomal protein L7/L12 [Bacteriovoracaceae bacterium]|nr:ribosomal protein L7/L12 [Bacteriovoracaceae bacterium]
METQKTENNKMEKIMKMVLSALIVLLVSSQVMATCDDNDVLLTSYGSSKLNVVKAVKSITSLGLKEAKELVDTIPSTILGSVSEAEAEATVVSLEAAGGEAEVVSNCEEESEGEEESSESSSFSCSTYAVVVNATYSDKSALATSLTALLGESESNISTMLDSIPVAVKSDLDLETAKALEISLESYSLTASLVAQCQDSSDDDSEVSSCEFYDVNLDSVGTSKLNVVKAIKSLTGLGLREAKDIADAAPSVVEEDLSYEEAQSWESDLEDAGGEASISESCD